MAGEKNLNQLLKLIKPQHNPGEYVFCTVKNLSSIDIAVAIMIFREEEAYSIIIKKETADYLKIEYSFIASWITLTVYSSLEAVGLTAAFSTALSLEGISCNVVAAFYHDHIFVDKKDLEKAMIILNKLSQR